jgi:anthranilate synthase component 2
VNGKTLPETVEITAVAENDCIMALQNREKLLFGVQFHPESIMTPEGATIIKNFIDICKGRKK